MGAILHLPQGQKGSGIDTSDATAQNEDVRDGKTFYARDQKLTGNMPTIEGTRITPSNQNQEVVGHGYLDGNITIEGDSNLIPSNIKKGITIFGVSGDENVIDTTEPLTTTASSSNVQTGMSAFVNGQKIVGAADPLVVSGNNITYTPTTVDQVIQGPRILQGNKTMTIVGDRNLIAENIKKGVEIFGVTGTYSPEWISLFDTTSFSSVTETAQTYGEAINLFTSTGARRSLTTMYNQDIESGRTYDNSYINEGRGYGLGLAPVGQPQPQFFSFGIPLNLSEGIVIFKTKLDQVSWGTTTFTFYLYPSTIGSWGTRMTDFSDSLKNGDEIPQGSIYFGSSQTYQEVLQQITIPQSGRYYAYITVTTNVDNAAPTLNKLEILNF